MKPIFSSIYAIALTISLSLSLSVRADELISLAWPDFNEMDPPIVKVSGNAKHHEGALQLTGTTTAQVGGAFYKNSLTLPEDRSFSAYFSFRMTEPLCTESLQTGGDGLTFTIKPNLDSNGSTGSGLGYFGIPDSIAVEFDTFFNPEHNDSVKNHVGINVAGAVQSVTKADIPYRLNDGQTYHAWIDYDGKNDLLEVRIAQTNSRPFAVLLSHKIDLEKLLGTQQFIGFTGSTGSCYENQFVNSLYFHAGSLLHGIDTSIETYATAPH